MDTAREMNYQPGKGQKRIRRQFAKSDGFPYWCVLEPALHGGLLGQFYSGFQGDGKAVSDKSGNRSSAL